MPKITYNGSSCYHMLKDGTEIYRGDSREVSQAYIDKYRSALVRLKGLVIEGDAGETVDFGNDGIPDSGWTKKDITAWLKEKGTVFSGYSTKAKLLDLVESTLNPAAPEPEVVEETIEEEVIEKPEGVE